MSGDLKPCPIPTCGAPARRANSSFYGPMARCSREDCGMSRHALPEGVWQELMRPQITPHTELAAVEHELRSEAMLHSGYNPEGPMDIDGLDEAGRWLWGLADRIKKARTQ